MKKEQFIKFLEEKRQMDIFYNYHKEFAKKILTPAQFSMQFQYFQSIVVEGDFGIPEPLIDFSGVYNKILKYYKDKFELGMLFNKEGKFIKYVY